MISLALGGLALALALLAAFWLAYWLVWFVPVDADNFYREDLPLALVNLWLFIASFGPFLAVALAITALHLVRHR